MNAENENQGSSGSGGRASTSAVGVPGAIVVAGALIAFAVYFSGTRGAATPPVADNQGAAGVPAVAGDQAAAPVALPVGDFRPINDEDHIRGPADATITLLEYSDLECPFCKQFHPTVERLLEEYPDDVRWVYRHFPLEQLHPNARGAALATECAAEQGRFWEMVDLMFDTGTTTADLALSNLPTLAQEIGVPNAAQFQTCLDNEKYADEVDADTADAQVAGGRGTPYSLILGPNDEQLPISGAQPYEAVKAAVDQLL